MIGKLSSFSPAFLLRFAVFEEQFSFSQVSFDIGVIFLHVVSARLLVVGSDFYLVQGALFLYVCNHLTADYCASVRCKHNFALVLMRDLVH